MSQFQLCIEPGSAPHTFDGSSEPFAFVRESLSQQEAIVQGDGVRGERSSNTANTRAGLVEVGGSIWLQPSPIDFDRLLPRILGAAEASDEFSLADTLPTFGVLIDRYAETFAYSDCLVDRAVLRGSKGKPLELELAIRGVSETTGTTFPTLTLGSTIAEAPYWFDEGVLTIDSQTYGIREFELVVSNELNVRYVNSITATSIAPRDRKVMLTASLPFTSTAATNLLNLPVGGVAGSLAFTNGAVSSTFAFPALQAENRSPTVAKGRETLLTLEMTARKTGVSDEIVVTNDSSV